MDISLTEVSARAQDEVDNGASGKNRLPNQARCFLDRWEDARRRREMNSFLEHGELKEEFRDVPSLGKHLAGAMAGLIDVEGPESMKARLNWLRSRFAEWQARETVMGKGSLLRTDDPRLRYIMETLKTIAENS